MTQRFKGWTLFLDRDGVLNKRLPGQYVGHPEELEIPPGVASALGILSGVFQHIFIVTNQQGIAKGLMTEEDLQLVHQHLLNEIDPKLQIIDEIYYCPHHKKDCCNCRKPATGMAFQALKEYPAMNFIRSVMVGDSMSDLKFGHRLGMHTVLIPGKKEEATDFEANPQLIDEKFDSLLSFARSLIQLVA